MGWGGVSGKNNSTETVWRDKNDCPYLSPLRGFVSDDLLFLE